MISSRLSFIVVLLLVVLLICISTESTAGSIQPPVVRAVAIENDMTTNRQFLVKAGVVYQQDGFQAASRLDTGVLISPAVRVPIATPRPFLAVGVSWTVHNPSIAPVMISLRGSEDSTTWGDWQDLQEEDDAPLTPGSSCASLIFLDSTTAFIQYRVLFSPNSRGVSPTLSAIRFRFISPGTTPETSSNVPTENSESPLSGAAYAMPPFLTRTQWFCPDGQQSPKWTPQLTTVTHLILHHTATPNSASDWSAVVRSIWDYHTNDPTHLWGDIGYNFLVDPNGVVYQGRSWWIAGSDNVKDIQGAHFSCMNPGTLGVAAIGTYTSISPTGAALARIEDLMAWKCADKSINPTASSYHLTSGLTLYNISGHRDGNSAVPSCDKTTVCPGDNLYAQLPSIRTAVSQRLISLPSPPTLVAPGSGSAPGSLVATTTPMLQWNSASGADHYGLYISVAPYGTPNLIYTNEFVYGTSLVLPAGFLANGGQYRWNMASYNASNQTNGSYSAHLYFQVCTPPASPVLTATPNPVCVGVQFCLNWNPVSGATSYEIQENGGSWLDYGNAPVCFAQTISGPHVYAVRGKTSCGSGSASSPVTVTVNPVPATPGVPSATPNPVCANVQYCVSWGMVSEATSYEIQENGGSWTDVGNVLQQCYTKGSGGTYTYAIRAKNGCGTSGASGTVTETVYGLPASPVLTATPNPVCVGVQFCLNWNAVSGATSYEIQENGGSWGDYGNILQLCMTQTIAGPHVYAVRGKTSCGSGSASSPVMVTVNPLPATPGVPSATPNPVCANVQYCVNWSAVSGAASYEISENSGSTWTDVGNTTSQCYTKSSAGTYSYVVRAKGCGTGIQSNPASVTVIPVPGQVGTPAATGGCNKIDLTWPAVTGATSYCVYRDGVQQICQPGTSWTDYDPGISQRCYRVSAKSECPGESGQSQQACSTSKCVSISGSVMATNNDPFSNIPVNLKDSTGQKFLQDTTSESGYYEFSALSPAVYSICLSLNDCPYTNIRVTQSLTGKNIKTGNPYTGPSVDVEDIAEGTLPNGFALLQNCPNPFNPTTEIQFSIPSHSAVTLEVFDITGRKIVTLADQVLSAGTYRVIWDSKDDSGNSVASGVYFYRLTASAFVETKKMVLLK